MRREISLGPRVIGDAHPVFIVAEIGINHNGSLELAKQLITGARAAGCDAVKFQKRTPERAVPEHLRETQRETPWGVMSYLEYRRRIEFGTSDYRAIDRFCREVGVCWFASAWDEASVDFLEAFSPLCYKVPSACLTDDRLIERVVATGRPVLLSTGMSTMDQIRSAVSKLGQGKTVLLHCTSTYPCPPAELNLRMIETLKREFSCPIGYSGHEVGLQTTYAAVALGACVVERHITLDRAMWGSDQAASVEIGGLVRLVRDIRVIEAAIGDGTKKVYESETDAMERLRRRN
jgi:N-acetylneuraminate synthase